MATMQRVITRAFRMIGVVASDEPMTADQAVEGLQVYNAMVAGWALAGIHASAHVVTLAEDFPLLPMFENAATRLLAEQLAPEYGAAVTFDTRADMQGIAAAYISIPEATMPLALRRMPSREVWRNEG